MPTRRFNGSTLEEAMERARRDAGADAKIISATRLRSGGIGGFFARERVEVEVEETRGRQANLHDRVAHAASAASRSSGSLGALDDMDAITSDWEDEIRTRPRRFDPSDILSTPDEPESQDDPLKALLAEMINEGPSSVVEMAEQINRREGGDLGKKQNERSEIDSKSREVPKLSELNDSISRFSATTPSASSASTDPAFAAVLERIARDSGLFGNPGEDFSTVTSSAVHASEVMTDLSSPTDTSSMTSLAAERLKSSTTQIQRFEQLEPPAAAKIPVTLNERNDLQASRDLEISLAETALATTEQTPLADALCDLGLELRSWDGLPMTPSRSELCAYLSNVLQDLPSAPPLPTTPGSVLVIVGHAQQATKLARSMSTELGLNPDDIVVATSRKVWRSQAIIIKDPEVASTERRSWRWRKHPTVVVLEAPVRPSSDGWAASMLQALEPATCWGVSDASRKVEDIATWSYDLGGLDALALVDMAGTASPAAALGAGIPVGRIDGINATAEIWAEMLCDRLAD